MAVATQAPERTSAGWFRWWYPLALTIPAAGILFYLNRYGANPGSLSYWVFGMAVISLIPLANWIAASTDAISQYLGQRVGDLLDATFGNVPAAASARNCENGLEMLTYFVPQSARNGRSLK